MTKSDKQVLKELLAKEQKVLVALSTAISNRELINDDTAVDKKERDRLKKRKEGGKVFDESRLKELNAEIRKQNEKLAQVRKNIQALRSRVKKIRQRIKKKRTQIRNAARPRIIDLNLQFKPMATQTTVDKVIGHYTAGPQDKNTEDAIRLCKIYHQAHLNQGWSGEAYMICITVDGDILILRPAKYVGAHTLGFNTGSYGIMMHGTTGDKPSAAQLRTLRWWAKNGHKPVMGKAQTQKAPKVYPWFGHNYFNSTSCPGSFKTAYVTKGERG